MDAWDYSRSHSVREMQLCMYFCFFKKKGEWFNLTLKCVCSRIFSREHSEGQKYEYVQQVVENLRKVILFALNYNGLVWKKTMKCIKILAKFVQFWRMYLQDNLRNKKELVNLLLPNIILIKKIKKNKKNKKTRI